MSLNVPDGHFHVFIFLESKFYALYNDETHFQIGELVAEVPYILDYKLRLFSSSSPRAAFIRIFLFDFVFSGMSLPSFKIK